MAIIRKYETKEECVGCLMDEDFDGMDSTLITELDGWEEVWSFVSAYDEETDGDRDDVSWYDEDNELMYYESDYTVTGAPAWNTWFVPSDGFVERWISQHLKEVCENCGFVAVMHNDEFYALAVDGAGYSFRDTHFQRLYDAMGFKWHE